MKGRRKWMNWKSNILHGGKESLKAFKRQRGKSDKNKGAFRKWNRDALACFYELDFYLRYILFPCVCLFGRLKIFLNFSSFFTVIEGWQLLKDPLERNGKWNVLIKSLIYHISSSSKFSFWLKGHAKNPLIFPPSHFISISFLDDSDTWKRKISAAAFNCHESSNDLLTPLSLQIELL